MKRQTLALNHLKEHGQTYGMALATAIGVSTNNLSTTMTPLVKSGAVIKGFDAAKRASVYTITKKGREVVTPKESTSSKPRIDPSDPFGLLAKLRASTTLSRHHTAPSK